MKILGIIPSRYASTRFPGKPLVNLGGKTMIRRVYERAFQSKKLDKVIVATDNQRIYDEVHRFGGQVMMTSVSHRNGTERCAEVMKHFPEYDYAINIQGDEPFIHPQQIDQLAALLDGKVELGTLVKKITDPNVLDKPTDVKVIVNAQQEAIYFSRTAVPFLRDYPKEQWMEHHTFYRHIGIYAYRRDILSKISRLSPAPLEVAESLEQLRWIENGFKIKVGFTAFESTMIDTPEDLQKAIKEHL